MICYEPAPDFETLRVPLLKLLGTAGAKLPESKSKALGQKKDHGHKGKRNFEGMRYGRWKRMRALTKRCNGNYIPVASLEASVLSPNDSWHSTAESSRPTWDNSGVACSDQ